MPHSSPTNRAESSDSEEWVLLQAADSAEPGTDSVEPGTGSVPSSDVNGDASSRRSETDDEPLVELMPDDVPAEATAEALVAEPPIAPMADAQEAIPESHDAAENSNALPVATSVVEPTNPIPAESAVTAPAPLSSADLSSASPLETTSVETAGSALVGAHAAPSSQRPRSWLFKTFAWCLRTIEFTFGLVSLVVLLAVVSGFPLLQVLVLGYLLEASRRIVVTGKVRSCVPGWRRAARIGSLALGTSLCLLPISYLSSLAEGAALVDPGGTAETRLRIGSLVAAVMLVPHMLAAWFCGGKLRYFFWPMLAPFQLGIWTLQWALASRPIRSALDETVGRIWPSLVHDLCRVTPITDFFLPAIIGKHLWRGTLWSHMRDGFWNFLAGLKPFYLGWLGLRCLIGSIAWLVVPTLFLIGGTALPEGGAILTGAIGVVMLGIVCLYLPTQQTHFAVEGKFYAMFDWAASRDQILRSPVRHSLAMFVMLAFALPLYLLKIELIDPDLWWALSLFFVAFSLPARWALGWAYARSSRREKRSWFIWRFPVRTLALAPALIFALFVSVTRFLSWGGVSGLFEHHAFLLPAPFTFYF